MYKRFGSPVIILGMHRSGTTLVSRWFTKMGFHMGVYKDHNEESLPFLSQNQKWLAEEGASWDKPIVIRKMPPFSALELYGEHIATPTKNPYLLLLKGPRNWGFKDPRNTFTLSSWLRIFPDAKIIHVVRHGGDVAKSLVYRNHKPGEVRSAVAQSFERAFELWEKYVAEAENYSHLPNYIQVKYEDVVRLDPNTLQKIERLFKNNPTTALEEAGMTPARVYEYSDAERAIVNASQQMKKLGYTD